MTMNLEDALREFVAAIVREELKTDWPKVGESKTAPEAVEEPEEDTPAVLEDSGDDSPKPDAVPTLEDAVARAKEVISEDGGKARLKTALSAVGATRVSAIPEDKITEFIGALDENSDPNGHVTDEDLESIKEMTEEDLRHAEDRLAHYPAPKWRIEDPFYDDVD